MTIVNWQLEKPGRRTQPGEVHRWVHQIERLGQRPPVTVLQPAGRLEKVGPG
ncbi:MAG: hypothetical protein U1F76_29045 [Candidatus Competibacteraceae bacterium]